MSSTTTKQQQQKNPLLVQSFLFRYQSCLIPILFEDKSPILHVTLSAQMGGVGMSETLLSYQSSFPAKLATTFECNAIHDDVSKVSRSPPPPCGQRNKKWLTAIKTLTLFRDKTLSLPLKQRVLSNFLPFTIQMCFGIRCTDESDTSKVQDLIDTIDNTSSVIKD